MSGDPDRSQAADLFTALWNAALRPLHSPHCGCCAGRSMTLTPAMLEDFLLDFLEDRFPHELGQAVAQRRAAATGSFAAWVGEADLAPEARASLITILTSMGERS